MKKILSAFIVVLVFATQTSANDGFLVHLNKPFYITGETIWYKLYCPADAQGVDFATKGLLVDSKGEIKSKFFHKSQAGENISGHLDLPYSYESGVYRLIFKMNNESSDQEIVLAQVNIPIYNDLNYGALSEVNQPETVPAEETNFELTLDVEVNSQPQSPGATLEVSVTAKDPSGNPSPCDLSISIIDAATWQIREYGYQHLSIGDPISVEAWQHATENIYVKGKVFKDQARTPLQANVLGAYASNQNKIYYSKSQTDGSFTLPMDDFYQEQTIQFIPYYKEAESLIVELNTEEIPNSSPSSLIYNEQIETLLADSRQRKKIAQHFADLRSQSAEVDFVDAVQDLKPNYVFKVDEYERFDRIYDFFTELMTPLEFRKSGGKYLASMSNPKATRVQFFRLGGSPLFIIDGKVTRNADFVAQLSMSNVESIEIYYSPEELRRQFNVLGSGGVVKINTVIPVFELPEDDADDLFPVPGLQQTRSFRRLLITKTYECPTSILFSTGIPH